MAAQPLQAVAAGTCDANGNALVEPGGGFSPGMANEWTATANLNRPGASITALVNGNPVASAYGLTAQVGPVQAAGNDQISFQVQGDTPNASVTVTVQGWQATLASDLPPMNGLANATIVNITPQDGAPIAIVSNAANQPTNYISGLLDVSQWKSVNLAVNPGNIGGGGVAVGVTLGWFAADGVTELGAQGMIVQLPAAGAWLGAQFPYAQCLFPNLGPLVQLAANAIPGPGAFLVGLNLIQSNRDRLTQPYSVQGPWLALQNSILIGAGASATIPFTALYNGPIGYRVTVPNGPSDVLVQTLDSDATYRTFWGVTGVAAGANQQGSITVPSASCQIRINNNSGTSGTYNVRAWPLPAGSS